MKYEVEQKHPVPGFEAVEARLAAMEATIGPPQEELDLYFAHPVRNFAETDEALRIRRKGGKTLITYKGPKIDKATKTRREIELPLATGTEHVKGYVELLTALGFRKVAEVSKRRRGGQVQWNQWSVELALDEVAGLGQYVELEIVAERDRLPAAQSALLELAAHLSLPQPERRSYLEMVLAGPQQ